MQVTMIPDVELRALHTMVRTVQSNLEEQVKLGRRMKHFVDAVYIGRSEAKAALPEYESALAECKVEEE